MKLDKNQQSKENQLLLDLIGEVIMKHRKMADLSQSELARLASVNRPYISDIERGLRNMSMLTLDSICAALECTPAELLQEVYELYQNKARRARKAALGGAVSAK